MYSRSQIRSWSIMGPRGAFGTSLLEEATDNEKIVALTADLGNTSGLGRFSESFPGRFVNTGIAEQSLVAVAAGFADEGYIPFASTFANFAALRACEFVRHFMGYMEANVKLIGIAAGYEMEYFGNTHYGLQDIAALRAIPNLCIISPADGLEIRKTIHAVAEAPIPVYIRLTGTMNNPIVYKEDYEFVLGKAITLTGGEDVAMIATGSMVSESLKAAKTLEADGISCSVINVHTLKPFDHDTMQEVLKKEYKVIVTVEEHSVLGGLGDIVATSIIDNAIPEAKLPLFKRLGAQDTFVKPGNYRYMLEQSGLTSEQIACSIVELL